jgi:hypothetical protein
MIRNRPGAASTAMQLITTSWFEVPMPVLAG